MSAILEALEADRGRITEWFEHLHRHPELSMREERTARYIADLVRQWGYEVETGVGKHGIVASMRAGDGGKAIGLRADFDALPIQEVNDLAYRSEVEGVAHLCGHD
ncbi:MAG TPA: amidohydrolase, partial [Phytomonospora sp.]